MMKLNKITVLLVAMALPLAGCDQLMNVANATMAQANTKTEADVIAGIKEALKVGIANSATRLGTSNGYFNNALVKILMPAEAQNVETKLRDLGFGNLVDNAIASMNHAAENAAVKSIPIFTDAISRMSITDAMGILKGGNTAATDYLKRMTMNSLVASYRPEIQAALNNVNATKYWGEVFTTYNKIPLVNPVNTDLTGYVTQKAIDGLFAEVAIEETKIRTDPQAQVSSLLKKVFGS